MSITEEMQNTLAAIRERGPLVHCITNYVTVNDVANALLAIGASPIMADAIEETADITAISQALVLNMGTLNARTVTSMIASAVRANRLDIPVVFDPVGAGASGFRGITARGIMDQSRIAVVRGNISEVSYLAGLKAQTKGVDAAEADEENDAATIARTVAARRHCTVAVTGAVDAISDGVRTVRISNGTPLLKRVTGTGCMTSALVGACIGTGADPFVATAAGVTCMGIAGDIAYRKAGEKGTGSFHVALIDALSLLDAETFAEYVKVEEVL